MNKTFAVVLVVFVLFGLFFGCTEKVAMCENYQGLDKAMCYDTQAGLQSNPKLCDNISDLNYRNSCIIDATS